MRFRKKPRVLLEMNALAAYRIPVLNLLSEHVDLEVACPSELGQINNVHFKYHKNKALKIFGGSWNFSGPDYSQYDVIISGFDGRNANSYLHVLRWPRRTILFSHGYGGSLFAAIWRRFLYRCAAAALVYTQPYAQQLIRSGVPGRKVFFTGNTVEVGVASERERTYFLHLGTPQARKGLGEILSALSIVRNDLPEHIHLVVAGPGVEEAYSPLVGEKNLTERVKFCGEIRDKKEIASLFSGAIAYVSGHIGLGAPQALGHGVPVIARSDVVQAPEYECLIDGHTGRTYRSVRDLSELLLDFGMNPQTALAMGRAGLSLYRDSLSAEAMCARIMEAIQYVLVEGRP